ncbi:MAG: T9SS type A sorting domain-containing protein [Bacteroidales bacterium]|nr:T9SS type A sorting domain-containing protein [Bacteroidales bacterium]
MKKLLLSMATVFIAAAMVYGQGQILINDFTGTLDPAKIYGDDYDTGSGPNSSTVIFEDNMLRADYTWDKPDWYPRAVWYWFDEKMDFSVSSEMKVKFMITDNDNDSIKVRFDLFGDGAEPLNDTIRENMETNGNPWVLYGQNGEWHTVQDDFTANNRWYCTYYEGGIPEIRVDSMKIAGFQAFTNFGDNNFANQAGTLFIDYIAMTDIPLGVDRYLVGGENAFAVAVYPSPTSDLLKINSETPVSRVDVYNITGKLVSSITDINRMKFEINVSELPQGLYITNVTNVEGELVSNKFIKE